MSDQSYYQILGVKTDASTDEIRRAYRDIAKYHHPDKTQDEEGKLNAEAYFSSVTEAFNVLTDPEKRKSYDEQFRRQSSSKETEQAREAKIFFKHGVVKFNEKNYPEAVRFFKAAVHYDAKVASYHAHLAMALVKDNAARGEAIRALEKAIELEPYNPRHYRMAGQIMVEAGMKTRAKRMFELAVKWDPADKVSQEELMKIDGKSTGGLGKMLSGLFKKS